MTDQVKDIIQELQKATNGLNIIRDFFQNDLDYFNEDDRRKINEFNATFEQKRDQIDAKINSFVRFIEKSFAPSQEKIAEQTALQKLRIDFSNFDAYPQNIKDDLLQHELKNMKKMSGKRRSRVRKEIISSSVSIDNPEPEKAFSVTYDFTFCRPSAIEILGERRNISTWRDALCEVADVLYSKDNKPLDVFIDNDYSLKPIFAIRPDTYRSPFQIVSGIYTEENLSAKSMLSSCRKLLDIYGVDYSKVSIYLSKISLNNV